jgi:hypothetical protein
MDNGGVSLEGFFDKKIMTVKQLLNKAEKKIFNGVKTESQYDDLLAKINYEAQKYNDCLKALKKLSEKYKSGLVDLNSLNKKKSVILSVIKRNCKNLQLSLGNIVDKGSEVTAKEIKEFREYLTGLKKIIKKKQSAAMEAAIDNTKLSREDLNMENEKNSFNLDTVFDGITGDEKPATESSTEDELDLTFLLEDDDSKDTTEEKSEEKTDAPAENKDDTDDLGLESLLADIKEDEKADENEEATGKEDDDVLESFLGKDKKDEVSDEDLDDVDAIEDDLGIESALSGFDDDDDVDFDIDKDLKEILDA